MNKKASRQIRSAALLVAGAGAVYLAVQIRPQGATANFPTDPYANNGYQQHIGRASVPVTVKRFDFTTPHPDFGLEPDAGAGRYVNMMSPELNADLRPDFQSTGYKVLENATDAEGKAIVPTSPFVNAKPGDTPGQLDSLPGGAVTSEGSVDQWFAATPGVNEWSNSTMNFEMEPDGTYVMQGSLDSMGAGTDYTSELGWGFVYEADRRNYLTIETGAEAWVYIDGKLVVDGGGLGGAIDFEIIDDVVIPSVPFMVQVEIAGAAFQNIPITTMLRVGTDTFEPFGPLDDPNAGNVDDNNNPRTWSPDVVYPAGTPVSMVAQSWNPYAGGGDDDDDDDDDGGGGGSSMPIKMTVDSRDNTQQVYVLRDGDPVPDIDPYGEQASIDALLSNYLDDVTGLVTLADNQVIYLYELWTTDMNDPTADFQDLVVVISLGTDSSGTSGGTFVNSSSGAAPRLSQTIDLSRLDWLQDRHPYRIQVFYANRSGAASDIRIETNLRTINVMAHPDYNGKD